MTIAKKKTTIPKVTLSEKDKTYIRLKCLMMVVENGSRSDAGKPQQKAEEYYNFIIGRKPATKTITESKPANVQTPQEIVGSVPEQNEDTSVISVFGNSDRKQVMI